MIATMQEPYVEHRNDVRPRLEDLPACPVETTAQLIGSKWRLLILRDLLGGSRRFGELRRSVGDISQKVLTTNLRDMEEHGLVVRRVYPEVPPRVEYGLTELGRSLGPVIDAMRGWGEAYRGRASGLS
ncbi:helix-turn-helix domain-containing protein [Olsenella sp. DNF00959]|uniref:winged helix-turn-helix transcriptional regulator n=1 Tax=Olsenella sp. DNF00959 TaxID=1476999 RepID=UPI0007961222|nr:helix-turn-helix domain-containing protein [Olsenella sp. DNF00959]KXB62584.1 HTH-type transcriptional activator HxlR family protein [Olsenella sp. DNF00959]